MIKLFTLKIVPKALGYDIASKNNFVNSFRRTYPEVEQSILVLVGDRYQ
jgi:hypothetical protein